MKLIMTKTTSKKDILFSLLIVFSTALLYFYSSKILSENFMPSSEDSSIYRFAFYVNGISAFLTPFLMYIFFLLSSYMMIRLLNCEGKIITLAAYLGYAFVPIFLSAAFSLFILADLKSMDVSSITTSEQIHSIKMSYGITFRDLNIVANASYILLYALLILVISRYYKLSLIKCVVAAVVPSLVVVFFKILLPK
jgi:hypothetical protein